MGYKIVNRLPDVSAFFSSLTYGIPISQSYAKYKWSVMSGMETDFFTIKKGSEDIGFFYIYSGFIAPYFHTGYIPYGPIIKEYSEELFDSLGKFLYDYGKSKGLFSVRADFTTLDLRQLDIRNSILKRSDKISYYIQPRSEWFLNLEKPIEKIFNNMDKNTRYSIRKYPERGTQVKLIRGDITPHFQTFWDLMVETSRRNGFITHPKRYFNSVFQYLSNSKDAEVDYWLAISHYRDMPLATALVVVYDGVANYLYAASSNKERNRFPTYGLIWESIKESKLKGCKFFNFGNVDPQNSKAKSSLSTFKQKFSGEYVNHNNLYEIEVNKFKNTIYSAYKIFFEVSSRR